ncbi:MarR family winged helix-turn-helix transcriptional regulator [Henriciella aquimarina]|uniref:MarR family winged helix-turn-helix transcriptional regulator n=1 Tax=Henriciella aquimarina TaxID=545261 RepID=UPI000A007637|nr:MarR family transcriptional regulator [Henriciella aquimarina]
MVDPDSDDRLLGAIELMYFTYRAFTSHADKILEKRGLNRVHHRVLYFIGRNPELTVGELVETLAISKQALNAPLRQLTEMNLVCAAADPADRRVKRLSLTKKGKGLEAELTASQMKRLTAAFDAVGADDADIWFRVMAELCGRSGGTGPAPKGSAP